MPSRHPLLCALSGWLALVATEAVAADALWRDAPLARGSARSADTDLPTRYRSVVLDRLVLDGAMRRARRAASPQVLELPLPDGGSTRFQLERSDVLPPGLAARYPSLSSMKGQDAEGRRVRVDIARDGVYATVRDPSGDWIVRPQVPAAARGRSTGTSHLVFRRADAKRSGRREIPDVIRQGQAMRPWPAARSGGLGAGGVLRTFRIAMSATSAYTRHMGGTVEDGLAGVVRTVNRVNEIFENDFGVHLVLAEDNDRLIFTRPDEDPFAGVGDDDIEIALSNVDTTARVLGSEAFDVGHVLDGKRDAGIAGALGNTCRNWSGQDDEESRASSKAAGMTGSTRPFGDAFHVDFVAHELGHQFGARHTFNGCGASRDERSAWGPGSGSTIMGYAGLCGSHDLQKNSDPYFHAASIQQVQTWLDSAGGSCAAARINTSPAPWIDTETWKPLVVPARTPFRLDGKVLFADPAATLTYTFEQMNLGLVAQGTGAGLTDTGDGPLFRSRPPSPGGSQTFPAMSVLLGDEPYGLGDALPTTNRNLRFRLTVRDNIDQRSHVASAERDVRVVDTGAAFEIVAPKAAAVLRRGKPRLVRWNVAGTAKPPISCEAIRIDLSLDGGRTFAVPLAQVPNRGRATVLLPKDISPTRRGRLLASCAAGGFFALSPGEFDIR